MMQFSLAISLLSAHAGLYNAQILPQYAMNLTLYHLHKLEAGFAFPLNMNSGDARGDLGFYLLQFLLPTECSAKYLKTDMRAGFDCANAERVSPNLAVTKVETIIDKRTSSYSACNACVDGKDPASGESCEGVAHTCACITHLISAGGGTCEKEKVGMELFTSAFPNATSKKCLAGMDKYCSGLEPMKCVACAMENADALYAADCSQTDWYNYCPTSYGVWNTCPLDRESDDKTADWMCWADNMPWKTRGHWYVTQKQGLCNASSPAGSCSWKVFSTHTIKNECLKEKIVEKVVTANPGCFAPYTDPPWVARSWDGWIQCFYETVLGKEASKRKMHTGHGGIPISELEKVWVDAFLPEAQGGCPKAEIESKQLWEDGIGQVPQPLVSQSQVPWFLVAALSVMVLVMARISCQLKQRLRNINQEAVEAE